MLASLEVLNDAAEYQLETVGNSHNSYIYENIITNYGEFWPTYGQIVEAARFYESALLRSGALITPFPLTSMEGGYSSVYDVLYNLPTSVFTFRGFEDSDNYLRVAEICFIY